MTMAPEPCVCRGPLARIYRSCPQHGEVGGEYFAIKESLPRAVEERNQWIRLFNRLDAAVSKHRRAKSAGFSDDADDALAAAHDRILKSAASRPESAATQAEPQGEARSPEQNSPPPPLGGHR